MPPLLPVMLFVTAACVTSRSSLPVEGNPPAASQEVDLDLSQATGLVQKRQAALYAGDWEAFGALLHPDARDALLLGFDAPDVLAFLLREAHARARTGAGTTPTELDSPDATLVDALPEGPLLHAIVAGPDPARPLEAVLLQRSGDAWTLALPEFMGPGHELEAQAGPFPLPTRAHGPEARAAFEMYQACLALMEQRRPEEYARCAHPEGVEVFRRELAALEPTALAPNVAAWRDQLLTLPDEALLAEYYRVAFSVLPAPDTNSVRATALLGGVSRGEEIVLFTRFRRASSGWVSSQVMQTEMRPHDGTWRTHLGSEIRETLLSAMRDPPPAPAPAPPPDLDCPPDPVFEVRLYATDQILLCDAVVSDALVTDDGHLRVLLTEAGFRSLAYHSARNVRERMDARLDGELVSSPWIAAPLHLRTFTVPVATPSAQTAAERLRRR